MSSEELSPERRKLYELLLKKGEAEALRASIRKRPEPDAPVRFSYSQTRILFFARQMPDVPAYNIPMVFRLTGPLDVQALERAVNDLIRRHEILRSTCIDAEGRPAQRFVPHVPLRLEPAEMDENEALKQIDEAARRAVDLTRAPLLAASLYRVSEEGHLLLLLTHHFASDGHSLRLMMDELAASYRGEAPPEPAISYADYCEWQGREMTSATLETQLAYWKKRLAGAPRALRIPTLDTSNRGPFYKGKTLPLIISKETTDRLRELARQEGTTLYMTVLTGLQVGLARLTGDADVIVGSPLSVRNRPEIESLPGNFSNYILFRTDLSGEPTLREALSRVRSVATEAYANQDLPMEMMVEDALEKGEPVELPTLRVLYVLRAGGLEDALALKNVQAEWIQTDLKIARVDFSFDLEESPSGIRGRLIYNLEKIGPDVAEGLLSRVTAALDELVGAPDARIGKLEDPAPESGEAQPRKNLSDQPADSLELRLHEIWERLLKKSPITREEDFFDLGGTSILTMMLINEVEKAFTYKLAPEAFVRQPTIRGLAELIREGGWSSPWKHLIPLWPEGPGRPVYFVHSLDGTIIPYLMISRHLAGKRPVYGIQPQGLGEKGYARQSFEDLAQSYLSELRKHQPEGPYSITGYCTGAMIAFEMAHQLTRAGEKIAYLGLIDPLFGEDAVAMLQRMHRRRFWQRMGRKRGLRIFKRIYRWFFGRQRSGKKHRRTFFGEGAWTEENLAIMLTHLNMRKRYTLRPLDVPVDLFISSEGRSQKEGVIPNSEDLTRAEVRLHRIPGQHLSMLREPGAGIMAKVILAAHE